ncbi:MAG: RNA methyltransferase [Glaciecola sp.]
MKLDDVKKLHQKKYRAQFGYYLVEGEHLVLELDKAYANKPSASETTLYVTSAHEQWAQNLSAAFNVVVLNDKQMSNISDTKSPQGIIACVPLNTASSPKTERAATNHRYIYLHEVQDPGNLGTILRSLAWFGQYTLLLSPNSVDPFNPKVVRSSMGAIFHVPIEQDVSLDNLQQRFTQFAYLDLKGTNIAHSTFGNYECYLFGNEARGVPQAALRACNASAFTIAGSGQIESLNLASAVNICVYQLSL